jgi:hypothetical protein
MYTNYCNAWVLCFEKGVLKKHEKKVPHVPDLSGQKCTCKVAISLRVTAKKSSLASLTTAIFIVTAGEPKISNDM